MLTQEILKEYLSYNEKLGRFIQIKPRKAVRVGTIAGSLNNDGYRTISIANKRYQEHTLVWLYVHGRFPKDQIDHINGVKDDNRISNLREVTHTENQHNKSLDKRNIFGYPGIRFNKTKTKYRASIRFNKVQIDLGTYDTLEEAAEARKFAERQLGFHENHGRAA